VNQIGRMGRRDPQDANWTICACASNAERAPSGVKELQRAASVSAAPAKCLEQQETPGVRSHDALRLLAIAAITRHLGAVTVEPKLPVVGIDEVGGGRDVCRASPGASVSAPRAMMATLMPSPCDKGERRRHHLLEARCKRVGCVAVGCASQLPAAVRQPDAAGVR